MEILDHTDEHQPTLMRDVYKALIGEQVFIYTNGDVSFSGKLVNWNGLILHLLGDNSINYYIPSANLTAIGSNK